MNRTELIEIIYALQQREKELRSENEKLQNQLNDRIIRIENTGSIAEAALSLNHIFEEAENAAQQYVDSAKAKFIRDMADVADEYPGLIKRIEKISMERNKK